MSEEQKKQLEAELAQREIQYKTLIDSEHERLKQTHIKKEFTFSTTEKRRLLQQETHQAIIQQTITDIVNTSVLPRVGITPDPAMKISYDPSIGKFTIWMPKENPVEKAVK